MQIESVTAKDIMTCARDSMLGDVPRKCVLECDGVSTIADVMDEGNEQRVGVFDAYGNFVGTISAMDLVRAIRDGL